MSIIAAVGAASGESNQFIAVICPDAKDIELASSLRALLNDAKLRGAAIRAFAAIEQQPRDEEA